MGTLRLWSFLLLVVLYVVCVVGRQRKYLEAGAPLHLVVLYGVCMVGRRRRYVEAGDFFVLVVVSGVCVAGRQRRYLKAGIFSSSGGIVWRAHTRASP